MPQTYAHQHYGNLVYAQLPDDIRRLIDSNRDLYDIGLQGPDILFYYHPLWKNPVSSLGYDMHEWSGRRYFSRAVRLLTGIDPLTDNATQDATPSLNTTGPDAAAHAAAGHRPYTSLEAEEAGSDDADAALVYLYGCLCHFTLDSVCHAYINRYDAMTEGVTHSVIEGDFDRSLIAAEGRDPVCEVQTAQFHPSREATRIIAMFYPEVPQDTLYKALGSFVSFHNLLRCPGNGKRNFLYTALRVIGQYDGLRGHITAPQADPLCKESTAHLTELLTQAVPTGVSILAGFSQNLRYDRQYRLNFEGVEVQDV